MCGNGKKHGRRGVTDPQDMLDWIDKRISSAMTWLDDHGKGSKRQRPQHEIETKEDDIAKLEEIKLAYRKALDRRNASENAA